MNIHVLGTSESFAQNTENSYAIALNIPLNIQTVRITSDTSVPTENGRVLAHTPTENQALYQHLSLGGAGLCVLLAIVLVLFIYLTRNTNINYTIKVKRLVNAYKSYIQQITNAFDMSGSRKFAKTPMLMRITSPRKVKYAIELLTELFSAAGLSDKKLSFSPTKIQPKTKKALLEEGLIRIEEEQNTN